MDIITLIPLTPPSSFSQASVSQYRCTTCSSKLTPTVLTTGATARDFYCSTCHQSVTHTEPYFQMNMTVADREVPGKLYLLLAFDSVVEKLMGCSAGEFDKVRLPSSVLVTYFVIASIEIPRPFSLVSL